MYKIMKKAIFFGLILGMFFSPVAYAQNVGLTPESKAELIAEIREKINLLMQELIAQLMKEMSAQTSQLTSIEKKVDAISTTTPIMVGSPSMPVQNTKPVITLTEQECRNGLAYRDLKLDNLNFAFGVMRLYGTDDAGTSNYEGGPVFTPGHFKNLLYGGWNDIKPGTYNYTIKLYKKHAKDFVETPDNLLTSKEGKVTYTACN
jgi:hypothetical protein